MRACISISKYRLLIALVFFALAPQALADTTKKDRSLPPEDDEFSNTPFTEYGAFNEDAEEEAETRFLQYGRLFGVSVGVGSEGALGNRGQLWDGGFPLLEIKVHYWFDFQMALDMGFFTAKHNYQPSNTTLGLTTVNMTHIGVNLKYYFDVKNLSAPISFANPYVLGGVGSFSKSESSENDATLVDNDTSLALNAGAGFEFVLKPKKTYFAIEGKIFTATFKDTNSQEYAATRGINDLSGPFYTFTGHFLFTW